jgi:hypothetical protein
MRTSAITTAMMIAVREDFGGCGAGGYPGVG